MTGAVESAPVIICATCGKESADDARFCAGCGSPLGAPAVVREERKVVTVVFADLVGSTALAEKSDPEDVRTLLGAHHARVRVDLERFGGTVEKFIGDAVVAVFGAPVAHEDDPERAVRAALAIRDAALDAGVALRVAVNTGEALVTLDARPAEGEGMVAGDVINTAARIQSAAPVNGVLVGETTYRATMHVIEYGEASSFEAKGKSEPVRVWEARAPRARFGSDVDEAPLATLVGREREIDSLRGALDRAREERAPQLVTLVGVPGIGKSRIVTELFSIVDDDPDIIIWRQGRCLPYGEGISYWALGEMAKSQAGILDTDTATVAQAKLTEAVSGLVTEEEQARWVAGHLMPLVGLGSTTGAGGDGRGEAFAAWRRFFEALGEQRPTVLVFEDLHWADDGLLDFVDSLVDRATGVPLLVLCSARPELLLRRPGWGGGKANAVTISLSALSDEDTARLISEHLAQAVLPAEMQQTLLRRADGNPLFAEEYIRMLRDRGLLQHEGGSWRLDREDVDVPETVQGIIAARLDALGQDEKAVLQAASVVGKVFWLGSVAAVADISAWDAEELLHALERKELVRRDRRASVAGETEYAVRHVLVRDVAYGQIPRVRRADLHVRAAAWIESLGHDRAEDRAEMLAHHYLAALELIRAAGGDTRPLEEPARVALHDAGSRAYSLSALESAADLYGKALDLWPKDDPAYPQLLLDVGSALMWTKNEGAPELTEASELLLAAGNREDAGLAQATLANVYWLQADQQRARGHYDRSIELIAGLPETRTTARIRGDSWRAALLAGERPSLSEGQRILELTERLGSSDEIHTARINLGLGKCFGSNPAEGMRELEEALEECLRANSHLATRACLNLASMSATLGDLPRAAELHRQGVELGRRFGSHHEQWMLAECAVDDYIAGDWDQAAAEALEFLEQAGVAKYMEVAAHYVLAAMASARGATSEAEHEGARTLSRARSIGDPQVLWASLGGCARVAADAGRTDDARALVDELAAVLAAADQFQIDPELIVGFSVAAGLGMADRLGSSLARVSTGSPWVDAAASIAAGRLGEAGDTLSRHHAHVYAATVRLLEAELAGRETPGLRAAVDFYEGVGATAYLARAERLLQASA